METISVYNFNNRPGEPAEIERTVRWSRRSSGGWNLIDAATGRELGWIYRSKPGDPWQMYVGSAPFVIAHAEHLYHQEQIR